MLPCNYINKIFHISAELRSYVTHLHKSILFIIGYTGKTQEKLNNIMLNK